MFTFYNTRQTDNGGKMTDFALDRFFHFLFIRYSCFPSRVYRDILF